MTEPRRVRDLLDAAAGALAQADVGSSRADARVLLAHVLQTPLTRLDLLLNSAADPGVSGRFRALVAERAARKPLAYVTGDTEFMGLRFRCDERALVPETETLAEATVGALRATPTPVILDLGTGTGALGLSLAVLLPAARVVLTDISPDALALARRNAEALGVADRARLLEGPDLEPVLAAGLAEEITCVAANPPYIAPADVPALPPEVARYEPRIAWAGEGADGLDAYRRWADQCARHLPSLHLVAFEVGLGQAESVAGLCRQAWPGFDVGIVKDLSGIDRVVIAQRQ
jgi:release factor glutamine methyltransferase